MIKQETIQGIKDRLADVERLMADPEVATDVRRLAELGREHSEIRSVVDRIEEYEAARDELQGLSELVELEADPEIVQMAKDEMSTIEARLPAIEERLLLEMLPTDPEDAKNAIVEIRAGTGGDEASLFAGDLYRLYVRFAEAKGWKIDVMNTSPGSQGGFKEIVFGVSGRDAFGTLKYESGVHRVQRVPATESSGRIHTSAATVAVLPEAAAVDIDVDPNELKVDVYRSSGPGGQSVNTTDSAVRITHIPTGLVVTCQDEKSQHKNKDKAMRVLRARLYELELEKRRSERSEAVRAMVSTGDRSAKIRTYNWPQGRVTDHRLDGEDKNHPLERVVEGQLDEIIVALRATENADRMASLE